jgi:hypothetical protein
MKRIFLCDLSASAVNPRATKRPFYDHSKYI